MSKTLQPGKLGPKAKKCSSYDTREELLGIPSTIELKAKIFVANNGSFLEKEFLLKEVSGRKVELEEVIRNCTFSQIRK